MYLFHAHLHFKIFYNAFKIEFFHPYIFLCHITLYWDRCNSSNLIRIDEDNDMYWLMLIMSKFSNNDFVLVVDSARKRMITFRSLNSERMRWSFTKIVCFFILVIWREFCLYYLFSNYNVTRVYVSMLNNFNFLIWIGAFEEFIYFYIFCLLLF